MLHCGLLGEKLGHSYSPQIHAELGDYEYLLYASPTRKRLFPSAMSSRKQPV